MREETISDIIAEMRKCSAGRKYNSISWPNLCIRIEKAYKRFIHFEDTEYLLFVMNDRISRMSNRCRFTVCEIKKFCDDLKSAHHRDMDKRTDDIFRVCDAENALMRAALEPVVGCYIDKDDSNPTYALKRYREAIIKSQKIMKGESND